MADFCSTPVPIKAFLGNDIRRFRLNRSFMWAEFQEKISGVFGINPEQYIIKVCDEEGEMIIISREEELIEAHGLLASPTSLLKVYVEASGPVTANETTSLIASNQSLASTSETSSSADEHNKSSADEIINSSPVESIITSSGPSVVNVQIVSESSDSNTQSQPIISTPLIEWTPPAPMDSVQPIETSSQIDVNVPVVSTLNSIDVIEIKNDQKEIKKAVRARKRVEKLQHKLSKILEKSNIALSAIENEAVMAAGGSGQSGSSGDRRCTGCQAIVDVDRLSESLAERLVASFKDIKIKQENQDKEVHPFITCNDCDNKVIGTRYNCTVCHDFDLCEECESLQKHDPGHIFLKIRRATDVTEMVWKEWQTNRATTKLSAEANSMQEVPVAVQIPEVNEGIQLGLARDAPEPEVISAFPRLANDESYMSVSVNEAIAIGTDTEASESSIVEQEEGKINMPDAEESKLNIVDSEDVKSISSNDTQSNCSNKADEESDGVLVTMDAEQSCSGVEEGKQNNEAAEEFKEANDVIEDDKAESQSELSLSSSRCSTVEILRVQHTDSDDTSASTALGDTDSDDDFVVIEQSVESNEAPLAEDNTSRTDLLMAAQDEEKRRLKAVLLSLGFDNEATIDVCLDECGGDLETIVVRLLGDV